MYMYLRQHNTDYVYKYTYEYVCVYVGSVHVHMCMYVNRVFAYFFFYATVASVLNEGCASMHVHSTVHRVNKHLSIYAHL